MKNMILRIKAWIDRYTGKVLPQDTTVVARGETVNYWCWLARDWQIALADLDLRVTRYQGAMYYQWFNGQTLVASGCIDRSEGLFGVDIHAEDIYFRDDPACRIIKRSIDQNWTRQNYNPALEA